MPYKRGLGKHAAKVASNSIESNFAIIEDILP
jgi:hypothetical protein